MTVTEKRMGADSDGAHQPSVDDVSCCLGMVQEQGRSLWLGISCELYYSFIRHSQERIWFRTKLVADLSTRPATFSGEHYYLSFGVLEFSFDLIVQVP